jgi:hypothetical protein
MPVRPSFSGLSLRELLAFLFAPAAITLALGFIPLVLGDPLAALSVVMLYWIVFVTVPTWAVGSRLYAHAKKQGVVDLKSCIAGGAIAKAAVVFGFGLIVPLFLIPFQYPLHEVIPQWFQWARILTPWGLCTSALGAVEGLLLWAFIRYWPPMRSEKRRHDR